MDTTSAPDVVTLIRTRAAAEGDRIVVVHDEDPDTPGSADTATRADLDRRARAMAAGLQQRLPVEARALLLYPTGIEYAVALLGCLYAGVVAVPAPLPDRYAHERRRVAAIARAAAASVVLTDETHREGVESWSEAIPVATEQSIAGDPGAWTPVDAKRGTIALLQYTSGSTGDPKGVMVTHGNMLHNAAAFCEAFDVGVGARFGGWAPLFHDMGLFTSLMPALLIGDASVLMSPSTFIRRPHLWLRLIDRHGVDCSAAPDFAYDLCCRRVTDEQLATLDLSRWKVAADGSEPVRAASMASFTKRFAPAGFRSDRMAPSYGLAEATVFVTGRRRREPLVQRVDARSLEGGEMSPARPGQPSRELVSCGPPVGVELCVVEPDSCVELPEGQIGEVWVRGGSVAAGYWENPEATARTFGVRTADGSEGWMRTGDLGALHEGELYIAGRMKDLLIFRGRNIYPPDVESELRCQHPELAGVVGAAFAVPTPDDEEALVVLHELRGRFAAEELQALLIRMRQTVAREFGVRTAGVALLRPGAVQRTTSGKVRRSTMREMYLAGELTPLAAVGGQS